MGFQNHQSISEAKDILAKPVGVKGSGVERFAAAMTLYQANLLSAQALEVFRVFSVHDCHDPRHSLIELNLPALP
ncbi:MAG: hypothetical protein QMB16_04325 [Paracoccaceae bacterium]|jgi:hypothetical protein